MGTRPTPVMLHLGMLIRRAGQWARAGGGDTRRGRAGRSSGGRAARAAADPGRGSAARPARPGPGPLPSVRPRCCSLGARPANHGGRAPPGDRPGLRAPLAPRCRPGTRGSACVVARAAAGTGRRGLEPECARRKDGVGAAQTSGPPGAGRRSVCVRGSSGPCRFPPRRAGGGAGGGARRPQLVWGCRADPGGGWWPRAAASAEHAPSAGPCRGRRLGGLAVLTPAGAGAAGPGDVGGGGSGAPDAVSAHPRASAQVSRALGRSGRAHTCALVCRGGGWGAGTCLSGTPPGCSTGAGQHPELSFWPPRSPALKELSSVIVFLVPLNS